MSYIYISTAKVFSQLHERVISELEPRIKTQAWPLKDMTIKEIYWKHDIYLLLIKLLCIFQFLASHYLCSVKEEYRNNQRKDESNLPMRTAHDIHRITWIIFDGSYHIIVHWQPYFWQKECLGYIKRTHKWCCIQYKHMKTSGRLF